MLEVICVAQWSVLKSLWVSSFPQFFSFFFDIGLLLLLVAAVFYSHRFSFDSVIVVLLRR